MKLVKQWSSRKGSLKLVFRKRKAEYIDLPTRNSVHDLTPAEADEFKRQARMATGVSSTVKAARKRKSA